MRASRQLVVVPLVAALLVPMTAGATSQAPSRSDTTAASSLCGPATPTSHPKPAHRLRFGVDPGAAGNPLPSAQSPKPVNRHKELAALRGLEPRHGRLVIRLNRLFWSGGQPLLQHFARLAQTYSRRGFDVEVQVRYHPTSSENGDLRAWAHWIRHVVDVLGRNRRLVSLTITNEVNFAISPNTSDGSYSNAKGALVRGIETAYDELRRHHWARRVKLGFTFAYRFNPQTDASLFTYLKQHGGARLRRALGFVGLDDYPGTVYPPSLPPGDTAGHELASALATMRTCYLPEAGLTRRTALWVTENGFPSNAPQHTEARQAAQLHSMLAAVVRYGGSYGISNYRWFNLRDNNSSGNGMFDQDGLLRDDYSHKPAYRELRRIIRRHSS